MIIPYGHEHTTVRRLPWVTFTLMGLCVLVFILTSVAHRDVSQGLSEEFVEFSEYLGAHPYLEMNPEFEEFLYQFVLEEQWGAYLEAARQFGAQPPTSKRLLQQEQEHLDEIMDRLLATLDDVKESPYYVYGLVPAHVRPHSVISYQFLHGGFFHLFGNLFFLFLVGPFIEDLWGRPLFAAFYLSAGAVSGLMYAAHYPNVDAPLIGASGAVAGVMGAFLVRYWKTRIRFFYWFGFVFTGTFTAPAWLMLPLWLARELLFAQAWDVMSPGNGGGGVAHWAHVWGFGFGMVVAGAVGYWKLEERFFHGAIESKVTLMDNSGVEEALATASEGDRDRALRLLERELSKNPDNVDAAVGMWNLSLQMEQPGIAVGPMLKVLQSATRADDQELVLAHWQDMINALPELAIEPALAVRLAEIMLRAERRSGAEESVELASRNLAADTPAAVLVRLARIAATLGMSSAPALVDQAFGHPDLLPEAVDELQRLREGFAGLDLAEPESVEEPVAPDVMTISVSDQAHVLQVMEAVPTKLEGETLMIEVGGQARRMSLNQVEAVAVAGIRGEGGRQLLVVDLMLDAPWSDRESLRVVRMLSTAFDPRSLVEEGDAMDAFKKLLDDLIGFSDAAPLPDPESARGRPFRTFESLEGYQREVLGVA